MRRGHRLGGRAAHSGAQEEGAARPMAAAGLGVLSGLCIRHVVWRVRMWCVHGVACVHVVCTCGVACVCVVACVHVVCACDVVCACVVACVHKAVMVRSGKSTHCARALPLPPLPWSRSGPPGPPYSRGVWEMLPPQQGAGPPPQASFLPAQPSGAS